MKPADLQTKDDLKSQLAKLISNIQEEVSRDREALLSDESQSENALADLVYPDVAGQPGAEHITEDEYRDIANSPTPPGESSFEVTFNDAKRAVFSSLETDSGFAGIVRLAVATALVAVEELETLTTEMTFELAQLTAAAASGLLVPPQTQDLLELKDTTETSKKDVSRMSNELGSAIERRQVARDRAQGEEVDRIPGIGSKVEGRYVTQTAGASENDARGDTGNTLVSAGPSSVTVGSGRVGEQAKSTSERLNDSFSDRVGYVVICAAIANMGRLNAKRDRATFLIETITDALAAIRSLTSDDLINSLQDATQEKNQSLLDGIVDDLQGNIDAIDDFIAAVIDKPLTFVSSVDSIGDEPGDLPVLQGLANICNIKISKFCDIMGLQEIAKSLSVDLSLEALRPPRFGTANLTLLAPRSDQITREIPIPGKEASILIHEKIEVGDTSVVARFSNQEREQLYDSTTTGLKEYGNIFGSTPGLLTIEEQAGTREDLRYTSVSFDEGTGNHTFTLEGTAAAEHNITLICTPDNTAPVLGDPRFLTTVGSTSFIARIDENRIKDINTSQPGVAILGVQENEVLRSDVDLSTAPNVAIVNGTTPESEFRDYHIGQTITFGRQRAQNEYTDGVVSAGNTLTSASGPFTADHVGRLVYVRGRTRLVTAFVSANEINFGGTPMEDAARVDFSPTMQLTRTITSRLEGNTITYDGADLSSDPDLGSIPPDPTDPNDERRYQFDFSAYEIVEYTSLTPHAEPGFWIMDLITPILYVHDIMRVERPQPYIRVQPDDQPEFLGISQPSDTRIRDDNLPVGSTLVRGTFDDDGQEAIIGPIIQLSGDGEMAIAGGDPFDYDSVSKNSEGEYEFVVSAGTPATYEAGSEMIVPMGQSLYEQANDQFPEGWEEPLDDFIAALNRQLERLEKTFCRMLGGRHENFTAVLAGLTVAVGSVTFLIFQTRVYLNSWLGGLEENPEVEKAKARLKSIGADHAVSKLSGGQLGEFGCLNSGEATKEGAGVEMAQGLGSKEGTEAEYRNQSSVATALNTANQSKAIAAKNRADIKGAQEEELQARKEGSDNLAQRAKNL